MSEPTGDTGGERREDGLPAIAALADLIAEGVVLTSALLRMTVEQAVVHGRVTREDAEGLARNLVAIGRLQARDALGELDGVVGSLRAALECRLRS